MVGFELLTIDTMLICDKTALPLWLPAYRKLIGAYNSSFPRALEKEDSIKAFVKRLKGCLAE